MLLEKRNYELQHDQKTLADLTEAQLAEEKQLIISDEYSKDMKKSLDKLKNIYLGGI